MYRVRHLLLAAASYAALCLAAPLGGQQQLLPVGARVRLQSAGLPSLVGTFVRVRPGQAGAPDSVQVRPAGPDAAGRDTVVPLAPGVRLEQSAGGQRRPGLMALLGAALTAGVAVAQVARCRDSGEGPPCALGYTAVPLIAVGGAVAGGALGTALPVWPERWRAVRPPARGAP